MTLRYGGLVRRRRLIVVVAAAMASAFAIPAHVQADCNPEGVPPTLEEASETARLIVVGDVIDVRQGEAWDPIEGRSSRFSLAVRTLVRGTAPAVVSIDDVTIRPCVGLITAKRGDRLALMLFANDPNAPTQRMSAVGWITGQPRDGVPFERVTEGEVLAMAGAVSPVPPAAAESGVPLVPVVVLAGLTLIAVACATWVRARHRA